MRGFLNRDIREQNCDFLERYRPKMGCIPRLVIEETTLNFVTFQASTLNAE